MSSAPGYYRTTAASIEGVRIAQQAVAHRAFQEEAIHETCEKIATWLKECFCCCFSTTQQPTQQPTQHQPIGLSDRSVTRVRPPFPPTAMAMVTVFLQR